MAARFTEKLVHLGARAKQMWHAMALQVVKSTIATTNMAVAYARPRLRAFLVYARIELRPTTLGEMPQVQERINQIMSTTRTGKWQDLTVAEAFLNILILLELVFCFFIGEVLGRGSLVGYNIPGAVHFGAEM